ncbi:SGNH/GDSL hydrolase family protein [Paludisphaera rhizosphaerae]|uniref:SGNH/GDSL hydrolase family protein n=1 Tax=Paludisphaera rhizosphaerae TaxID=2711216 RepID=UPI0013EDEA3A|nr:GDSL-type esterase/lipase family protein [Paludisphaera rhizosphaerae]
MRPRIWALTASLLMLAPTVAEAGDYALRDGDSVVLLGDSITAARTWGRIVENYTLLRFPERRVHFHNAAWGGDTAAGGLARMDRDVLAYKPTVLIVAYGVNDIGWGTKADDAHKQAYLDGIRGIVEKARAQGCRVYIGSAAATAEDPDKAEHGYLQTMCDEGMALARSLGEHSIDIQRGMRAVQRRMVEANAKEKPREPHSLHVSDGVHLNDLGQLAMAFAVLDGLDAPAEVSSVAVDANSPALATADGCKVSNLKGNATRLEFDRLDAGLPLNLGLFGALQYRFIPVGDRLNRYMLTVRNLPEGEYTVTADGRGLGKWPAKRLAEGVNIASATANGWEPGGPWEAAAWSLAELTQARVKLTQYLLELARNLPDSPVLADLQAQTRDADRRIEDIQHTLVSPRPFHFVVERAEPAK